jgi:hypothetical protein
MFRALLAHNQIVQLVYQTISKYILVSSAVLLHAGDQHIRELFCTIIVFPGERKIRPETCSS